MHLWLCVIYGIQKAFAGLHSNCPRATCGPHLDHATLSNSEITYRTIHVKLKLKNFFNIKLILLPVICLTYFKPVLYNKMNLQDQTCVTDAESIFWWSTLPYLQLCHMIGLQKIFYLNHAIFITKCSWEFLHTYISHDFVCGDIFTILSS